MLTANFLIRTSFTTQPTPSLGRLPFGSCPHDLISIYTPVSALASSSQPWGHWCHWGSTDLRRHGHSRESGNPLVCGALPEVCKLGSRFRGNDGSRGARNSEMTPLPTLGIGFRTDCGGCIPRTVARASRPPWHLAWPREGRSRHSGRDARTTSETCRGSNFCIAHPSLFDRFTAVRYTGF